MLTITFESHDGSHPAFTDGPFVWVEVIGANVFGLRPGAGEASEIAGANHDFTWDAGPADNDEKGGRKRRHYSRWALWEK